MNARLDLSLVRSAVQRRRALTAMMDAAVAECIAEGRANPRNPLVCVLDKPWHPGARTVAQKWRDEAAERLAPRAA